VSRRGCGFSRDFGRGPEPHRMRQGTDRSPIGCDKTAPFTRGWR
jgi:hypothetical protein